MIDPSCSCDASLVDSTLADLQIPSATSLRHRCACKLPWRRRRPHPCRNSTAPPTYLALLELPQSHAVWRPDSSPTPTSTTIASVNEYVCLPALSSLLCAAVDIQEECILAFSLSHPAAWRATVSSGRLGVATRARLSRRSKWSFLAGATDAPALGLHSRH